MKYTQELTFQLRMRGQTESEIAETLREIEAHGAVTDEQRLAEFGSPADYADRFEKKRRRTSGSRITATAVVLAVVLIGGAFAMRALLRESTMPILDPVGSPWLLLGALAICIVGLVAGFLVDYLRPARTPPGNPGVAG